MRNFLIFCCCFPFILSAAQPAVIKGKVEEPSDKTIEFFIDRAVPGENLSKQPFKLNADFEWSLSLAIGNLVHAAIGDSVFQLFIEPGDALTLSIKAEQTPFKIDFSGKGAENNNLFSDFLQQFKYDFLLENIEATILASGSVDVFESAIFDKRLKQMKLVKDFQNKNTISPGFRQFIENQISYNYFRQLLYFPVFKNQESNGLTCSPLPTVMLNELPGIQVMSESAMNSPAYREFLKTYIFYFTAETNEFKPFSDHSDLLERSFNYSLRHLSGEPFRYWLATALYQYCEQSSSETVKKLHKALTQSDPQKQYALVVEKKCQQQIIAKEPPKEKVKDEPVAKSKEKEKKSDKDKPSDQPFSLVDLKGNKVNMSSFKGKVLYVDFWASWCGPCRQQFPYAKELHKQLTPEQKKQVVFLYISIDNNEEVWKNAIQKFEIDGFHTLSPGGWGSSAAKHFGVSSIPRYMLINKKGEIADPNAKRPSAGDAVIQDILRLLKE